jgi:ADP-heptose:LPS heptosyltransferase
MTHLAAACGLPTLALFGPTDPRLWRPRGPRVHVLPLKNGVRPIVFGTRIASS